MKHAIITVLVLMSVCSAWALGSPPQAQVSLSSVDAPGFLIAGAEQMLRGYSHLLFLLGLMLVLRNPRDAIKCLASYTLAHSLVFVVVSTAGVTVNPYQVGALVALSVIYIGFANLNGFKRLLDVPAPPLLPVVFFFGLIHGLGFAANVQSLSVAGATQPLLNIIFFNLGLEFGQLLALCVLVPVISAWRATRVWAPLSRLVNLSLIVMGGLFALVQLHGDLHPHEGATPPPEPETSGWHSHGDGPPHIH